MCSKCGIDKENWCICIYICMYTCYYIYTCMIIKNMDSIISLCMYRCSKCGIYKDNSHLWGYWKKVFIFRSSEPNSGVTISKVVELLCPIMSVYENVRGAMERTTDANGRKYPPAIEAVEKDANENGYHFAAGLMMSFPPSSGSSSLSPLSSSSSPSLNTCMSLLTWCSHHGIYIYTKRHLYIYIYINLI